MVEEIEVRGEKVNDEKDGLFHGCKLRKTG